MLVHTEEPLELTVVMPCLNEAETIGICIKKAKDFIKKNNIIGEIVVADNGSDDGSQGIALELGAKVVNIKEKGYGNALKGGIAVAKGKFVIMGDSDDSYDFSNLMPFIKKLREGYDLVMGNRFKGGIKPRAMPPLHKYLGNPVLTTIGRLFFRCPSRDFHCGLRGFKKTAAIEMDLQTAGMEFASEMVIKATLFDMKIAEVPTTLSPDGRSRSPHLRSWRDGWRHLRFMLLYSPRWLFLYPGITMMLLGSVIGVRLLVGPITVGSVNFDVQTLLFTATAIIVGYQSIQFAVFAKFFAVNEGLLPPKSHLANLVKFLRSFNLEIGIIIGLFLMAGGMGGAIYSVRYWGTVASFGPLDTQITLRFIIPSITAIIVGFQTLLASFFLGILNLSRSGHPISQHNPSIEDE